MRDCLRGDRKLAVDRADVAPASVPAEFIASLNRSGSALKPTRRYEKASEVVSNGRTLSLRTELRTT